MKSSMLIKVRLFVAALVAALAMSVQAQVENRDSLQVSLLTCGPGTEVYELFGHTALRVR